MAEYDLLIKNGTIVDGLRTPAYRGDLAIRNGKIVAMGNIKGDTTRVVDATGCIVAPGFMDIHTHYDAALTGWDPYATLSGWHGVTSVAIGNCGKFCAGPGRCMPHWKATYICRVRSTPPLLLRSSSVGQYWWVSPWSR